MSVRLGPVVLSRQGGVQARVASLTDNGDGTVTVSVLPRGASRQWYVNGSIVSGATGSPQDLTAQYGDVITCRVVPESQDASRTFAEIVTPPAIWSFAGSEVTGIPPGTGGWSFDGATIQSIPGV